MAPLALHSAQPVQLCTTVLAVGCLPRLQYIVSYHHIILLYQISLRPLWVGNHPYFATKEILIQKSWRMSQDSTMEGSDGMGVGTGVWVWLNSAPCWALSIIPESLEINTSEHKLTIPPAHHKTYAVHKSPAFLHWIMLFVLHLAARAWLSWSLEQNRGFGHEDEEEEEGEGEGEEEGRGRRRRRKRCFPLGNNKKITMIIITLVSVIDIKVVPFGAQEVVCDIQGVIQ